MYIHAFVFISWRRPLLATSYQRFPLRLCIRRYYCKSDLLLQNPQFQRDSNDGRPNQHPHPEDLSEQQPTAQAAAHFRDDKQKTKL